MSIFYALIILFIYLIFISIKYKQIPESISQSYQIGPKWSFFTVMSIIGVILAWCITPVTLTPYEFFGPFICFGLIILGITPLCNSWKKEVPHTAGVYTFSVFANAWAAFCWNPYILLIWLLYIPFAFTKIGVIMSEIFCIGILSTAYYFVALA